MSELSRYVDKFSKLRRDPAKGWPASTRSKSPYKPLLLLAVLDQFDQGQITHNLIELTPDLGNLFDLYCATVLPPGMTCNIAMPFFHMQGEGFWQLVPLPGKEAFVASGRRLITESQLANNVAGARLDDELFALLVAKESRDILRAALVDNNFDESVRLPLWQRSTMNQAAHQYSSELLAQARSKLKEVRPPVIQAEFVREVRDQGFRRAVVVAYNHRCACCGLRIVTLGGRTAVEAAHIVPWHRTRNDHPTNGMALCRLCHWSFDEGLMSVTAAYRVILSPHLAAHGNIPGALATLDDQPIFLPQEDVLCPDHASLEWRNRNVFRKV